MRWIDKEPSDFEWKQNCIDWPSNESLAVSINSPLSTLLKSASSKEDSSIDFSRSGSEEGFVYAYNLKTLTQKAKSLKKSDWTTSTAASLVRSHEPQAPGFGKYGMSRARTLSTANSDFTNTLTPSEKSKWNKAKVLKYVQNLSNSFESILPIEPTFVTSQDIKYYKAIHELDGQTYILKKRRIYVENCQEIQDHEAYNEIRRIKDNSATLNIRYVNSWVEVEDPCFSNSYSTTDNGMYVNLCIQMRYISNFELLARDLIILTQPIDDLDEDTLDDMSEDTFDEAKALSTQGVSFRDAITETFAKIGLSSTDEPKGAEAETWRICFEDALL